MNCICKAFSCECIAAIATAASLLLAIIMVSYNRKVISENQRIALSEFRFKLLMNVIKKYIPIFKILGEEIKITNEFKNKVNECFNKLDFRNTILSKIALGGRLASSILEMDKSIKRLNDAVNKETEENLSSIIDDIKRKKKSFVDEMKMSFLVDKGIDVAFLEYDSIDALLDELLELAGVNENE